MNEQQPEKTRIESDDVEAHRFVMADGADGADEDTEGHRAVMADGADEDTEGHRVGAMLEGTDEDTEGHRAVMVDGADEDDDVEGHRIHPDQVNQVQPPRDADNSGNQF